MSGVVLDINKQKRCLLENERNLWAEHFSHSHTSWVTSSLILLQNYFSRNVIAPLALLPGLTLARY